MWSKRVRQAHRWVSLAFMIIVAAIFVAMGAGKEPAEWVFFLPLIPLALLMFTGLSMLCWPYAAQWRSGGRIGEGSEAGRQQSGRAG